MGFTKGGIEKNEEIEDTAIREVEEETGVTGLKIVDKLQRHIIFLNVTVGINLKLRIGIK